MKRILLLPAIALLSGVCFGQGQIGNSDMEQWETVASAEEPVNWNGFLSASGSWAWAAQNALESSTDVRPGSPGTKSARIWCNVIFGVPANGNMTVGQINMGSTTPTDPSNYNISRTVDADFSEDLADTPDSLVFWAKFNPNNTAYNARVKATLHDAYDYQDPEDATSANHVVAIAELNFPHTSGSWVRISVPFSYTGPASGNTNILITFTTNETAGVGDDGDELFIDDIELIYNPNGIDENVESPVVASLDNEGNSLMFTSDEVLNGNYMVYSMSGQLVQEGTIENKVDFPQNTGMYIVSMTINDKLYTTKVVKY